MPETKYCQSKTMSCTSHSHNFWPPRGVSCSIPWIRPSTNQTIRSRQAIKRITITCIYYRPVLARFIPMLLKGDMLGLILGLILGLSSLSVPFILANSFSCSFLYWSMDSSCTERERESQKSTESAILPPSQTVCPLPNIMPLTGSTIYVLCFCH